MKRKLHMAKNMEALNAMANVQTKVANPRTLVQSAMKMHQLASEGYANTDEELAYLYYMRYLALVKLITKTPDYKSNPKYYKDLLGNNNLNDSINKSEILSKSLMDRYDERRAEELASQLATASTGDVDEKEESSSSAIPVDNGEGDGVNVAPQLPGGVVPFGLYQRLKSGKEKVLILDIRSADEYREAKMKYPDLVVSIPAEAIAPGSTINRIEEELPLDARVKLNGRGNCDLVVIVDWNGSVAGLEDPKNPLKTVKDALWKYDAKNMLKNEPIVLEGGFEDWFEHYPMLVVGKPTRKNVTSSYPDADFKLNFDYEYEEYDPSKYSSGPTYQPPPKPVLMSDFPATNTSQFIGSLNGLPMEEAKVWDSSTTTTTTTNIPSINRSLKPKVGGWTEESPAEVIKSLVDSPRMRPAEFTSGSRESLNSVVSSADSEESAAERDKELRLKDAEMAEKQERLRLLEETLESKQKEIDNLHRNIEDQRISRQMEEEDRERRNKEEEERKIETENLRNERKMKESEDRKKQAEREAAIRLKEEEARGKLQREREELEKMRAATEADKRRVAAEKAAVEETKRRLEEAARKKPKPGTAAAASGALRNRSNSPSILPQKQPQQQQQPPHVAPGASPKSVSSAAPTAKPRPLVDRTAKPNSNNNAKIVIDWRSRIDTLRPVGGGPGGGLTGLRNLGNTCYMNSIIQCLSNTAYLTYYFREEGFLKDINCTSKLGSKGELALEFATIVRALWDEDFKHISPRTFKHTVGRINSLFVGNDQQDSSELLLFLLDGLHEDLNLIAWDDRPSIPEQNNDNMRDVDAANTAWENHQSLNDSVIVQLFQGQLKSTVQCSSCRKQSVTFDPFMYLSLPVPSNSRNCTVEDCMELFLKAEQMTGSSQWFCPRCKCSRDAVKKIDIWKLPVILLIHLKRFSFDGYDHRKITSAVDFPLNQLDMGHFTKGPSRYKNFNLYAVSNHYGSMEGGHYTAYGKNPRNHSWFKFDDHEVSSISSSDVKSSAAYILFYTAKEFTIQ